MVSRRRSSFNWCVSVQVHIWSYTWWWSSKILLEYSHEHIVNIWPYREYPVNIMFKSREYKKFDTYTHSSMILTHIHMYEQILTAKKRRAPCMHCQASLHEHGLQYPVQRRQEWVKTSAVSIDIYRSISDHIIFKNILGYSHEHICSYRSYRKYLVNILWISVNIKRSQTP